MSPGRGWSGVAGQVTWSPSSVTVNGPVRVTLPVLVTM